VEVSMKVSYSNPIIGNDTKLGIYTQSTIMCKFHLG